jgi:hypothetical protein
MASSGKVKTPFVSYITTCKGNCPNCCYSYDYQAIKRHIEYHSLLSHMKTERITHFLLGLATVNLLYTMVDIILYLFYR